MTLANSDRMEMELETMMSERRWAAWSGPRGARVLGSTVVWLKAGLSILDYCLRLPLHLPSPACYSSIHSSHSLPLLDSSLPSYSVQLPSTCLGISCEALIKFLEMMTKSFEITSCFLWHPLNIYHNSSGTATPITTGHLNNKSTWPWTLISESFQKKEIYRNVILCFSSKIKHFSQNSQRPGDESHLLADPLITLTPPFRKLIRLQYQLEDLKSFVLSQILNEPEDPRLKCRQIRMLECCWGPVMGVYYI